MSETKADQVKTEPTDKVVPMSDKKKENEILVTYKHLNSTAVESAINKLLNLPGIAPKQANWIAQIGIAVRGIINTAREELVALHTPLCKKDEKGEALMGQFEEGKEAEAEELFDKLMEKSVTLNFKKIDVKAIEAAQPNAAPPNRLTPAEIYALSPLLKGLED